MFRELGPVPLRRFESLLPYNHVKETTLLNGVLRDSDFASSDVHDFLSGCSGWREGDPIDFCP